MRISPQCCGTIGGDVAGDSTLTYEGKRAGGEARRTSAELLRSRLQRKRSLDTLDESPQHFMLLPRGAFHSDGSDTAPYIRFHIHGSVYGFVYTVRMSGAFHGRRPGPGLTTPKDLPRETQG